MNISKKGYGTLNFQLHGIKYQAYVYTKLKAVEEIANDSEIQTIRTKLEEVSTLAKDGKAELLSAKATELKSAFVKVYLKRG